MFWWNEKEEKLEEEEKYEIRSLEIEKMRRTRGG